MLNGRRRWLALGALAGVLIVGAGAALAASGSADNGFLAGVASRLGISEDKLKSAITDETIARIDAAVRRGDLTEEQGERLKERARAGEGLGRLGLGPGLGIDPLPFPRLDFGRGFGHAFKAAGDQIEAAADYLGLTRAQLLEELSDGDSLADVARQKGKSVDGLKTAMRNAMKADLEKAVDDGVLTRQQADRLYEKLSPGIDRLVEHGLPVPKRFGRGFGFGLGGGDVIEAAADYLGLTEAQLGEALSDGDSLADVARQKGKSVDGLKTAMRTAMKADLDKAVEKGAITREHANEMLDELSGILDDAVEGNVRGFGFRMKFRGPGGDMEFGFGPEARLPGALPVPDPIVVQAERVETF